VSITLKIVTALLAFLLFFQVQAQPGTDNQSELIRIGEVLYSVYNGVFVEIDKGFEGKMLPLKTRVVIKRIKGNPSSPKKSRKDEQKGGESHILFCRITHIHSQGFLCAQIASESDQTVSKLPSENSIKARAGRHRGRERPRAIAGDIAYLLSKPEMLKEKETKLSQPEMNTRQQAVERTQQLEDSSQSYPAKFPQYPKNSYKGTKIAIFSQSSLQPRFIGELGIKSYFYQLAGPGDFKNLSQVKGRGKIVILPDNRLLINYSARFSGGHNLKYNDPSFYLAENSIQYTLNRQLTIEIGRLNGRNHFLTPLIDGFSLSNTPSNSLVKLPKGDSFIYRFVAGFPVMPLTVKNRFLSPQTQHPLVGLVLGVENMGWLDDHKIDLANNIFYSGQDQLLKLSQWISLLNETRELLSANIYHAFSPDNTGYHLEAVDLSTHLLSHFNRQTGINYDYSLHYFYYNYRPPGWDEFASDPALNNQIQGHELLNHFTYSQGGIGHHLSLGGYFFPGNPYGLDFEHDDWSSQFVASYQIGHSFSYLSLPSIRHLLGVESKFPGRFQNYSLFQRLSTLRFPWHFSLGQRLVGTYSELIRNLGLSYHFYGQGVYYFSNRIRVGCLTSVYTRRQSLRPVLNFNLFAAKTW